MPGPYNDFERNMLDQIAEHGFFSMGVFDDDLPSFRYTVGLTTSLNAPELIIFGLDLDLMHNMLWEAVKQMKDGLRPTHGMRWPGLLEGFDCVSVEADHGELFSEYLTSAKWYWQDQGKAGLPPVYQIVWPGAQDGLFPWDQGCADIVMNAQPQLWSKPV